MTLATTITPIPKFQHFGDFDKSPVGGKTPLLQWTGKVRKRYNAFVNHANLWLAHTANVSELYAAINEIKRLAQLRLYEVRLLQQEFDPNGDGPGSADFICYGACQFYHAMYKARTEFVIWECLRKCFFCVKEPHGIIRSRTDVISNRTDDDCAWSLFCDCVEKALRQKEVADIILGPDAHSVFLQMDDEILYAFQDEWTLEPIPGALHVVAPIYADSPDYGYAGSHKYALAHSLFRTPRRGHDSIKTLMQNCAKIKICASSPTGDANPCEVGYLCY
jgi:hypothetical protein